MHLVEIEERVRAAGGGPRHDHLVCRSCGLTVDVDSVIGTAPCLHAPNAAGFTIDDAQVTFHGLCPDCQT